MGSAAITACVVAGLFAVVLIHALFVSRQKTDLTRRRQAYADRISPPKGIAALWARLTGR